MKIATATNNVRAFTLAEVLAALLFMAIVVPVAMQGLHIASLYGSVARRKGQAARIAHRVLNESLVMNNWNQSIQSGSTAERHREIRRTLPAHPWTQDPARTLL